MNQAIAEFCVRAYTFLLPIAWIGVAIVALVLLPMAIFRATRRAAGTGMVFSSYLFGITTWFQNLEFIVNLSLLRNRNHNIGSET